MHGNAIVRFIFILSLGKAIFGEQRGKVVDIGGRMNKIATKIFSIVQYLDGLQEGVIWL
jgi:hypothetical protein